MEAPDDGSVSTCVLPQFVHVMVAVPTLITHKR